HFYDTTPHQLLAKASWSTKQKLVVSIFFFLFLFISFAYRLLPRLLEEARKERAMAFAHHQFQAMLGRVMKVLAPVILFAPIGLWLNVGLSREIKYAEDPNANKRLTLLLRDFDPHSMLHVPMHATPRAKFPVIDVHNHVNDAGGIHGEAVPPAEVVRI